MKNRLWTKKYQLIIIGMLITAVVLLSGCGCNYHLKRVKAKCKIINYTDTVTVRDTVYIPRLTTYTVFSEPEPGDTVFIDGEVKIKYVRLRDSVYIAAECPPDTIIVEKKVPVVKTIVEQPNWLQSNAWWLLLIAAVVLVARQLRS